MGTARGYSESELRAMVQDVESDLVDRPARVQIGDRPPQWPSMAAGPMASGYRPAKGFTTRRPS